MMESRDAKNKLLEAHACTHLVACEFLAGFARDRIINTTYL